jgi:hypothetical protein
MRHICIHRNTSSSPGTESALSTGGSAVRRGEENVWQDVRETEERNREFHSIRTFDTDKLRVAIRQTLLLLLSPLATRTARCCHWKITWVFWSDIEFAIQAFPARSSHILTVCV